MPSPSCEMSTCKTGVDQLHFSSQCLHIMYAVPKSCLQGSKAAGPSKQRSCLQEGDLDSAIKKYKGYLPEDDIMLKFVQIALALHYTHSRVRLLCVSLSSCTPHTTHETLLQSSRAEASQHHYAPQLLLVPETDAILWCMHGTAHSTMCRKGGIAHDTAMLITSLHTSQRLRAKNKH